MEISKMNIYQKIQGVMQDIQYLAKDDQVAFGSTKYRAISEEKVTSTVRAAMIKFGLVMYPKTQDVMKDGQITTVNTVYAMVNVDNPAEQIMVASSGQGSDTQDKGAGKAMTYAFKYALLRTYMIPTGEDPDKISSAELDAKAEAQSNPDLVRNTILELAKGDVARVNAFIKKFLGEDKNIDNLTADEYVKVKIAIGKKVNLG